MSKSKSKRLSKKERERKKYQKLNDRQLRDNRRQELISKGLISHKNFSDSEVIEAINKLSNPKDKNRYSASSDKTIKINKQIDYNIEITKESEYGYIGKAHIPNGELMFYSNGSSYDEAEAKLKEKIKLGHSVAVEDILKSPKLIIKPTSKEDSRSSTLGKNIVIETQPNCTKTSKTNELDNENILSIKMSFEKALAKPLNELSALWEQRLLLPDLNTACEILAAIRVNQGIDSSVMPYSFYKGLPQIKELEDTLSVAPDVCHSLSSKANTYEQKTDMVIEDISHLKDSNLLIDQREQSLKEIKIRMGQEKFKKELLKIYGTKCMLSKSNVNELIEAAHITPYMGVQSNHWSNGLLLRVDIHRLFDRNLIKIDENYNVWVSPDIRNSEYNKHHKTKLFFSVKQRPSSKCIKIRNDLIIQ